MARRPRSVGGRQGSPCREASTRVRVRGIEPTVRLPLAVIASVAALVAAAPPAAAVTTFTVNETGNLGDANTGDNVCDRDTGTGGLQCTLRAAVEQANATANSGGNDVIRFDAVLNGQSIAVPTLLS